MVAERFYIGAGEKALVAGCKRSDFEAWLKRHPVMLERIDFLSEDDIGRKDSISGKYKGVLFCRHINHPDNNKIEALAKKAGVKQPAISRFEKRGEVKLRTLADTIKALGGKLEVRAHFADADIPISILTSKK